MEGFVEGVGFLCVSCGILFYISFSVLVMYIGDSDSGMVFFCWCIVYLKFSFIVLVSLFRNRDGWVLVFIEVFFRYRFCF